MALTPYIPKNTMLNFEIKIDGVDNGLSGLITEAVIHYEMNKIPFAKFTFVSTSLVNDKEKKSPLNILKQDSNKDKVIEFSVRSNQQTTLLFSGYIKAIENKGDDSQSVVKIECKDLSHKLTFAYELDKKIQEQDFDSKLKHFTDKYGIKIDTTIQSKPWSTCISSYKNNPWDYLVSFMDSVGMMVNVRHNKIGGTDILDANTKEKYVAENGTNLFSFSAKYDDSRVYSSVTIQSWDSEKQEAKKITETSTSAAASKGQEFVANTSEIILSNDVQQLIAKTIVKKSELAVIYGKLTTFGNTIAKLGDYLRCLNANEKTENVQLLISSEIHTIENGCWKTEYGFGLEQQASFAETTKSTTSSSTDTANAVTGQMTTLAGLQIGIVTNIEEDPNKAYRVKVKIPALAANSDGVWARLACMSASQGYGNFFIPDVGDEVVIGCLGNNPDTPIILGSLYSKKHTAPQDIKKENYIKGIYTKEGSKIEIDEEKKSIEISTKKGNILKLSEDGKGIEIQDENQNKIIMDDSGITIESAKDLILKAKVQLKMEGASVENNASGNMVIKGSVVQIN